MKDLIKNIDKKKLLTIAGVIVGVIVLIIVILLLYNKLFTSNTYSDVENKMLDAAKNYYDEHQNLLPKNTNDEVSINSTTLTSEGYLKDLEKLTPGNATCTATVTVTNLNNSYRYTSKLKCGTEYETKNLADYIKSNESVVNNGQGLYELNGELVYRGDNPNNKVSFAGHSWNIVKIEDGRVMLILNEKYTRIVWDNRYNVERKGNEGINDYSVSRMNDYLTNLYNGEALFNKSQKLLVSASNLPIGKREESIEYNDGSIEKSESVDNKFVGLLPLYDYINASLDVNCYSALTQSCANYNYLTAMYNWWTITADYNTTHKVYKIGADGRIYLTRAATDLYVRPVIYLVKDAIYVSGNGTTENPYTIK